MLLRSYSFADKLIQRFDQAVRTVVGKPLTTERADPAQAFKDAPLTEQEKKHIAGLMRVNHVGEICAQALYQGQALTAKLPKVKDDMARAAQEESDHLAWCERRTHELGGHRSYLSPLWYAGSFAIGAVAGAVGDKWSLGFVAETEKQVVKHLEEHLTQIPSQDEKTRAILEQMKVDEQAHATQALEGGGAVLPLPIKFAMKLTAKLMTTTAYRI